VEGLNELQKVEIQVDTTHQSLQTVGEVLFSLQELKLNDSLIKSVRDLGTSFKNVKILYISRCKLANLAGILAFQQLEELYASYNYVEDLYDVGFLENLQVLDLEGNLVSEQESLFCL
jgi:Leucine-rich repeat (LRR) protein